VQHHLVFYKEERVAGCLFPLVDYLGELFFGQLGQLVGVLPIVPGVGGTKRKLEFILGYTLVLEIVVVYYRQFFNLAIPHFEFYLSRYQLAVEEVRWKVVSPAAHFVEHIKQLLQVIFVVDEQVTVLMLF
jgi:hypothetical protein